MTRQFVIETAEKLFERNKPRHYPGCNKRVRSSCDIPNCLLLEWIESRDDADAQIVCGDFNASPDKPAAQLMAKTFRYTQSAPAAFSPLAGSSGVVSHPYWERFDRCIDYIWIRGPLECLNSAVCFNEPDPSDNTLWPSDHAGLWADLRWSVSPQVT